MRHAAVRSLRASGLAVDEPEFQSDQHWTVAVH